MNAMSRARILHLFANFKWTGPADPAIRTAAHLRALGADVVFAEAQWTLPGAEHRMRRELARWRMPVIGELELRKHFRPHSLWRDVRRLKRRLERGDFDVLHAHLPGDHLIASLAAAGCSRPVVVVRSLYDPHAPRRGWRSMLAFRSSDGVIAPTRSCADEVVDRFGLPGDRVRVQEPPTELRRAAVAGEPRAELGLDDDHVVVGITARVQPHRRFELLWDVARKVCDARPEARFVLLGRGNEQDTRQLVREPLERLGLTGKVVWPGYLFEPAYSSALRALDVFLFLVPGSDGTCRAVREAMACGLPIVATPRGILPELVGTGADACGVIADESADALATALIDLVADASRRRGLGDASRAKVVSAMHPVRAAQRLLEFYGELAERRR